MLQVEDIRKLDIIQLMNYDVDDDNNNDRDNDERIGEIMS